MMPVTTGDSSPEVAATIASSIRASPRSSSTLGEQRTSLQIASECNEVGLAEALADLRGARGGIVRFAMLARAQMPLPDGQQQVALLDAVLALPLDQALRPAQPSARASGFAAREQAKAEPERGARRGRLSPASRRA